MAMVAKQLIVWHSSPVTDEEGKARQKRMQGVDMEEPDLTRIEVMMDSVVPDIVPRDVQEEWLKHDWIYEDPTKKNIAAAEGPPRMSMPLTKIQKVEAAKRSTAAPVLGRTIPPRPIS